MSRLQLIKRLEALLENNKEFYLRHPDLKEIVEIKIKAIRDNKYTITDANYIIGVAGAGIRDTQMFTKSKKKKKVNIVNHSKQVYENDIKGKRHE